MKIHGLSNFSGSILIWQPGKTFLPIRDYTRWSEYVHAESYVISPDFRGGFRSESIQLGVFDSKEPPIDNAEGFLSLYQFENKGKLSELHH